MPLFHFSYSFSMFPNPLDVIFLSASRCHLPFAGVKFIKKRWIILSLSYGETAAKLSFLMGQKPQLPAACQQSLGKSGFKFSPQTPQRNSQRTRCQLFWARIFQQQQQQPVLFWRHQVQNHITINRLSVGESWLLIRLEQIADSARSVRTGALEHWRRHKSGRRGRILIPAVRRKHHKALSMAYTRVYGRPQLWPHFSDCHSFVILFLFFRD